MLEIGVSFQHSQKFLPTAVSAALQEEKKCFFFVHVVTVLHMEDGRKTPTYIHI